MLQYIVYILPSMLPLVTALLLDSLGVTMQESMIDIMAVGTILGGYLIVLWYGGKRDGATGAVKAFIIAVVANAVLIPILMFVGAFAWLGLETGDLGFIQELLQQVTGS